MNIDLVDDVFGSGVSDIPNPTAAKRKAETRLGELSKGYLFIESKRYICVLI